MKALNYLIIAVVFSISASEALAQRAIVPVERPSSSQPQSFYVNVSVDHENRIYEEGDLMTVTVESSKPGYLYLLYKDASGSVALLFPNRFHTDNHIAASKKVVVPSSSMSFDLQTMAPFGKEKLQAIVSLNPINTQALSNSGGSLPFQMLNSRQLDGLKNEFSRAIGVVGRNQEESSENDVAEYTMEITTVKRGQVPQTNKKRIFVGICVAKYSDSRIPALPACEKDIVAIGRFFNSSPAIDSDESLVYINKDVTKEKIRALFYDYLPNHTNPGDEVIIYWTGHGARCADTSGDEKDRYDETLVLYDSKPNDPSTQLIDDDFGRWVQNLSGRKVLFIMDTCHSEGMGNRAKALRLSDDWDSEYDWDFGLGECSVVKDLGQPNLALIASCAKDEVSLVREDDDMSVMTWYVVDCLKKNPSISHKELHSKIKSQVYDYVMKVYDIKQNVGIQDEFESPMILNP